MPQDSLPLPLREAFVGAACRRLVLSERRPGVADSLEKVTIRPIVLRGEPAWQFTLQHRDRAVHENHSTDEALTRIAGFFQANFLQGALSTLSSDWSIRAPRSGSSGWKLRETNRRPDETLPAATPETHNRSKNHLIPEGVPCPFLNEMGVMTAAGQVRRDMYAKFRQVNRFLELVDDVVQTLPRERPLRVIDFGCGKSYLTFALHHLLTKINDRAVQITGLDLKADVIAHCQAVARKLECNGLNFEQGTIAGFSVCGPVDLVVSLHACDTATDDALAQAIVWQAQIILAVPCCQHELASQLTSPDQTPLLRHGILRERIAALATDALRAQVMEIEGYTTQVVEFIDLEHTPKNLLLRGVRRGGTSPASATRLAELAAYKHAWGVESTHLEARLAMLRACDG